MKRYIVTLLSCAMLLVSCTKGGGEGGEEGTGQFSGKCGLKIINGSKCDTANGPVVLVDLYEGATRLGICTGTFITPSHVITAAHCFTESGANRTEVVVGSKRYSAGRFTLHPRFRQTSNVSGYDAAIVELDKAASGVETMPLFLSEGLEPGMTLNIMGYGLDENGDSAATLPPTDALKKAEMTIEEVRANVVYALFDRGEEGICSGDSGGPAFVVNGNGDAGLAAVSQAVGGLNLSAVKECKENTISVFTDLQNASVSDWIFAVAPGTQAI